MADFCLIPSKIEQFKKDLKDDNINLKDLLSPKMSSENRIAIFSKYASSEDAKGINGQFESKLVLKNRMLGIENLFSKLGKFGKYSEDKQAALAQLKSEYKAAQQNRIFNPTEHETFLNTYANQLVKNHITLDQAGMIHKLSNDIKTAQDTTTAKLSGVSDEYLKANNVFNNYVASLQPTSHLSSIGHNLSIIGRNNLLMNPATPLKTLANQIVNSKVESIGRRLSYVSLGIKNGGLARQARNEAWTTFRKTGQNTAAMESKDDTRMLGTGKGLYKGEQFNPPTGNTKGLGIIETPVRAIAKISNKIAINIEHNIAFTRFYQKTFFDTANIISNTIAKNSDKNGAEIFKDAVKIIPQTEEGKMVRKFAQQQAARITSTNDTWMSKLSLAGKNALNEITPGFGLGNWLVPIAKIPANIVANAVENSGVGLPKAVYDIFKGRSKMQSDNLAIKYEGIGQFHQGLQRLMVMGGTMATAAYIASQFQKKDFRTDNYGAHFVKIGNTWINTEYFSTISPALGGFMKMKETGGGIDKYAIGVAESFLALPQSGIDAIQSAMKTGYLKYAGSFVTSRGVPAFVGSLTSNRPIEHLLFGAHGVESTQEVKQDAKISAAKAVATRRANAIAKEKALQ